MRLRRRPAGISGQAARNPELKLERARLYVIAARLDVAEAAVRGGADALQLRNKTLPRGELMTLARQIRDVARDVLFIVNDFVDIALLSEADGVHLGPDDMTIEGARSVADDRLIIGASASSVEAAQAAVAAGADYLGSGPAFPTPIKREKRVIGPQGIAAIAQAVDVPVFAIGGIDETNVAQLTATGLHRVCVIRAVGDAADPEAATRRLRAMLTAR